MKITWEHEEKQFEGYIELEEVENGKIEIKAISNWHNETFMKDIVSCAEAITIMKKLAELEGDITYHSFFN